MTRAQRQSRLRGAEAAQSDPFVSLSLEGKTALRGMCDAMRNALTHVPPRARRRAGTNALTLLWRGSSCRRRGRGHLRDGRARSAQARLQLLSSAFDGGQEVLCGRQARLIALELQDLVQVVLEARHRAFKELHEPLCERDLLGREPVELRVERGHGVRDRGVLAREGLPLRLERAADVLLRLFPNGIIDCWGPPRAQVRVRRRGREKSRWRGETHMRVSVARGGSERATVRSPFTFSSRYLISLRMKAASWGRFSRPAREN